ncbi:MAG: type II secretion system protein GspG [bacterium]
MSRLNRSSHKSLETSALSKQAQKGAFTLIEILCVIVIIAILSAILLGMGAFAKQAMLKKRAMAQIMQIHGTIVEYKVKNGGLPPDLESIVGMLPQGFTFSSNVPLDPWSQRYQYTVAGSTFNVFSKGPDKATGSADTSVDDIEFKR